MNRNEPDATRRRCGVIPFVNADGAFTAGITFATGLGEVLVSLDGAAPVAAANNIVEIGRGFYYYPASQAETNCSRLIVFLRKGGYAEQSFTQIMGGGGMVRNQSDASRRLLVALPFYDLDGALLPGLTFLTASSEVLVSINGAAWAPAASNAFAVGDGIYGYPPTQAETNAGSFFAILLAKGGYVDRVYTQAVADAGGGDASTPTLTVISVFPLDFEAARLTQWEGDIRNITALTVIGVLVQYDDRNEMYTARDADGTWRWPFDVVDSEHNSIAAQDVLPCRLKLLPRGGWPNARFEVQVFASQIAEVV